MKQGILIDLTALLDVVINLMFLVLVTSTQQIDAVKAKAHNDASMNETLTKQVDDLKKVNSGLLRKVDSYIVFEENCSIMTLSIANGGSGARTVLLESEDGPGAQVPLTWENGQYAKNLLRSEIGRRIKDAFSAGSQFVFIVFRYERDTIYQSDYELLDSVIQAQKAYDNVYFAEYDILEAGKDE